MKTNYHKIDIDEGRTSSFCNDEGEINEKYILWTQIKNQLHSLGVTNDDIEYLDRIIDKLQIMSLNVTISQLLNYKTVQAKTGLIMNRGVNPDPIGINIRLSKKQKIIKLKKSKNKIQTKILLNFIVKKKKKKKK
eukprot:62254_1